MTGVQLPVAWHASQALVERDVRAVPAGRRRAVVAGRAVAGDAIVIEGTDPGRGGVAGLAVVARGNVAGCLPVAMVPSWQLAQLPCTWV